MIRRASSATISRCCQHQHHHHLPGGVKQTPLQSRRYLLPIGSMGCIYDVSSARITRTIVSARRLNESYLGNRMQPLSTVTAASPSTTGNTSSAAAETSSSTSSNQQQTKTNNTSDSNKNNNKSKKDDSNIFLDNLGKIFLSTIGLVLVMLLRSTKSNNARTALREDLEYNALLDPLEIDDLRLANEDFTIEIWDDIVKEMKRTFPNRSAVTYPEFLSLVMNVMRKAKGEGFTVQFGHLVDRVVIAELERLGKNGGGVDSTSERSAEQEQVRLLQAELPITFLFAALSLALHSTVTDRVRALFDTMVLERTDNSLQQQEENELHVDADQVSQMIQHLQNTCQLVPEAQIVETNSKVPYQTFRVGTGDELTMRARGGFGGKKGSAGVTKDVDGPVSLEDFRAILKSRAVCAWGECYVKKLGRTSTSDR